MDVTSLLSSLGDDAPSGENLEYDPAFVEMELAAQPGEERQEGDKILEAEDPDFGEVIEKAEAVLGRSHDIRAAVFYAEAVLYSKGMEGFAEATALIRGYLENFWDTCHPELDEDDGNDPTMRINAVQGLNGTDTVVKALRRTKLTDSRMFGQMSLRAIDVAEGTIPPPASMTDIPDASSVGAAFQDTDPDVLAAILASTIAAQADIKAIDEVFSDKTPGQGPDLNEVTKTLNAMVRRLSDAMGTEDAASEEAGEPGEVAEGEAPAPRGGTPGAISSRQDVLNTMDRILGYYARYEPSSPVPMFLERCKKLVDMEFAAIIKEIAPSGFEQVKQLGGLKDEDYY
ncbi:Type VI secretion-associated protein, ImpA family [Sulfitobacter noctilucae]|uniref:type VI secretion system protein TssA n=1 Tax=Sulfitobacter noctilucae TaxID=1342302 RepID=UPI000469F861|nr:type VI secretion system protein TssA [Sulfitobacter noctilucae]KIN70279.1 Type VI secretion-associated protein, ImpA family [Sulfitobacter noctilucae]